MKNALAGATEGIRFPAAGAAASYPLPTSEIQFPTSARAEPRWGEELAVARHEDRSAERDEELVSLVMKNVLTPMMKNARAGVMVAISTKCFHFLSFPLR